MLVRSVVILGGVLFLQLLCGCDSSGPGKPLRSDSYQASRDEVFDALLQAMDAYYDLDEVNREAGTVTTHWDMSHAAGVFSQQGYRSRAFGKVKEDREARRQGVEAYVVEVKAAMETNMDADMPIHPDTSKEWRKEGNNPTLANRVLLHLDSLLRDYGPSNVWYRRQARLQE